MDVALFVMPRVRAPQIQIGENTLHIVVDTEAL
jgi:hypothetical protein